VIHLSAYIRCDDCGLTLSLPGPRIAEINDRVSELIARGWVSEIDGEDCHRCPHCAAASAANARPKLSPVCTVVDHVAVGRGGNLHKTETLIRRIEP
jgi:hypothetical protein